MIAADYKRASSFTPGGDEMVRLMQMDGDKVWMAEGTLATIE